MLALLRTARAIMIDLLGGHLTELERALGTTASEQFGQYHGVGDMERYHARIRAVEYAIEHDDGQSLRALDIADVVIVAPSRCGKTPTTMYLALQYGLLVSNYPLTDEDFPAEGLPRPIAPYAARCFGLTTTPLAIEPGAARAPAVVALRVPRAVHARAASRGGTVPAQSHPVPEFRDQERRGDVRGDPADHEAARVTAAPREEGRR